MDYIILFLFLIPAVTAIQDRSKWSADWESMALKELERAKKIKQNECIAKNIIVFIGDGMGPSTVTAGRIYKGQKKGQPGEEGELYFESFPYTALSKIYGHDRQVPDSAQTATAILSGVKTNWKVLGLKDIVEISDCSSEKLPDVKATSILKHALAAGKSTGIVTSTRITHATPGAAYAHTVDRNWESDADLVNVEGGCKDIAYQLVHDNSDIQVLLGGGRRNFIPNNETDPLTNRIEKNQRLDGSNLINIWQQKQQSKNRKYKYVWNKGQFDNLNPNETDYLLGLFNPSHLEYELEKNTGPLGEPTLAEMTSKAIQILKKKSEGFFLLVEGGRIDHAHHDTLAKKALEEVLAFDDAVSEADKLTDDEDTLIIVTADHSHVFNIGGYNYRGNDILGLVDPLEDEPTQDGLPFTTLVYGNGPGWQNGTRENLTTVDIRANDYIQASAIPLDFETHSGEDVAVYAKGPMSHLFHSVHEQHYIAHVMQYSSCIGQYTDKCDERPKQCGDVNGSNKLRNNLNFSIYIFTFSALYIITVMT